METCRDCLAGSHEECHEPCRCRDRAHLPETVDLIDHVLQAMIAFVTYLVSGPTASLATKTRAEWLGSSAAREALWRRFDEYAFTTFVHLLGCAAKERQETLNRHGVGTLRASRGCPCEKCGPAASDGVEYDSLSTGAEVERALDAAEERAEVGDDNVIWEGTLIENGEPQRVAILRDGDEHKPKYDYLGGWRDTATSLGYRIFDEWAQCLALNSLRLGLESRTKVWGGQASRLKADVGEELWRTYKKECPGCDDSHRLAFLAGFDSGELPVVFTSPTPLDITERPDRALSQQQIADLITRRVVGIDWPAILKHTVPSRTVPVARYTRNGASSTRSVITSGDQGSANEPQQPQAFLEMAEGNTPDMPVPMILPCPTCHLLHVDRDEWETTPHRTHLCEHCQTRWRPANIATVGVEILPTHGSLDPHSC